MGLCVGGEKWVTGGGRRGRGLVWLGESGRTGKNVLIIHYYLRMPVVISQVKCSKDVLPYRFVARHRFVL